MQSPGLPDLDLIFSPATHAYSLLSAPDLRLTSVTSWLHAHTPQFRAARHARRLAAAAARPTSPAAILARWELNAYQARRHGTAVHALAEAHARCDTPPVCDPSSPPITRWFASHPEIFYHTRFAELRVCDRRHRLAGSIDLFCHLDGVPTLVDFKTSRTIDFIGFRNMLPQLDRWPDANGVQYALQLRTYAEILRRAYGVGVARLVIVHITPRGWEEIEVTGVMGVVR